MEKAFVTSTEQDGNGCTHAQTACVTTLGDSPPRYAIGGWRGVTAYVRLATTKALKVRWSAPRVTGTIHASQRLSTTIDMQV